MANFADRSEGAAKLLPKLAKYRGDKNCLMVGLPRGGVVTASVLAKSLSLPLGYLIIKKIGAPGNSELAVGAVDPLGTAFYDAEIVGSLGVSKGYLDSETTRKKEEARKRQELYREIKNPSFSGKTVILVDDGIATGTSMLTAIKSARQLGATKVVVAVPVIAKDTIKKIEEAADQLVTVSAEPFFSSVGQFYADFPQVEDEEVIKILKNARF